MQSNWRKKEGNLQVLPLQHPFFFLPPDFSVLPWKPCSLAHASKPEPLPAWEGGRENNCMVGVSGEWDYCKLKHWAQNIPFSLGWGGGGLLVFSWSVSDRYRRCLGHNNWVLINGILKINRSKELLNFAILWYINFMLKNRIGKTILKFLTESFWFYLPI